MSYYILPKNINNVTIAPHYSSHECNPYVSYSLSSHCTEMVAHLNEMFENDPDTTLEEATRIIHPCEFVFSKSFSVSKLTPRSNTFYELIEIIHIFSLFDKYKNTPMATLHVSSNASESNASDSIESLTTCRDGVRDSVCANCELTDQRFDYVFYETDTLTHCEYIVSLVKCLVILMKHQAYDGTAVIKIQHTLHKPVIDCLYLLCSIYDKVYIAKPSVSNITNAERYIVCKSFQHTEVTRSQLKLNTVKLIVLINKLNGRHIADILGYDVPQHFKNKVDDLNVIIGQQQIDALDQIITLFKHKNRQDKIDSIKKTNIQKSAMWCDKYKIPYNKYAEKINIFLPI